MKGGVWDKKRK